MIQHYRNIDLRNELYVDGKTSEECRQILHQMCDKKGWPKLAWVIDKEQQFLPRRNQ